MAPAPNVKGPFLRHKRSLSGCTKLLLPAVNGGRDGRPTSQAEQQALVVHLSSPCKTAVCRASPTLKDNSTGHCRCCCYYCRHYCCCCCSGPRAVCLASLAAATVVGDHRCQQPAAAAAAAGPITPTALGHSTCLGYAALHKLLYQATYQTPDTTPRTS